MGLLKDKLALITGAGGGIGRGIARCYAREGAAVLIAELDPVTGAEAEAELQQMGARALFVPTDVLRKDSVEAAIQAAADSFGGLDILINNAFVPSENVLLEDKTDAMLERTLTSTVWASWWAMRAAMPHMRQRGGGRIINFTSIDVDIGAWQHADYNTGKSGVVGLTRSAAAEWGRFNITCNAIAPGNVTSDAGKMLVPDDSPFIQFLQASCATRARGAPEELVGTAILLCSQAGAWITGQTIHIDGGWVMRP